MQTDACAGASLLPYLLKRAGSGLKAIVAEPCFTSGVENSLCIGN